MGGSLLLRRSRPNELVSPFNKVLHIRCVRVTSIVLSPGKLTIEKSGIYRRHLRRVVITLDSNTPGAEQRKDPACIHGGHETSLVVEPLGIALCRDTVTDKGKARCAQC